MHSEKHDKKELSRIELLNVSKGFSGRDALVLSDINLNLQTGWPCFIYGQNGSGKTTLLRILAGLSKPSSGEVITDRKNIKVCLLSAFDSMYFQYFTGEEYMAHLFTLYGISRDDSKQLISDARKCLPILEDALKTPLSKCSAGMKQMIRLHAYLNVITDLYLLDEPFRSLDPEVSTFFLDRIRLISKSRLVVFSGHEVSVARGIETDSRFLKGGRLV